MIENNAVIVILSYPDTIVRPAYWERSSIIWPKIGVGGKHAVQAGHAALLLIKKNKTEINYFDFGRYMTSYGNGRVRSVTTDVELLIPIQAKYEEGILVNINEILLWLDKHPEKTHGEGRLVASINYKINYLKAKNFIEGLISKKEIPYGAFIKKGSNCARFVNDTIIEATTNKKTRAQLKTSNIFTPSPIGTVIKGTSDNIIYKIENQKIELYENRSILKEYRSSFFNKFDLQPNLIGTEKPNKEIFNLENATWISGIGSGAWFKIEEHLNNLNYRVSRYTVDGIKDFESDFIIDNDSFNLKEDYAFIHPTNCNEVFVLQNGKNYYLKRVNNI